MAHMLIFSLLLSTKVIKDTPFYNAEYRAVVIDAGLTCLETVALSRLFGYAFPSSLIQAQSLASQYEVLGRTL